MNLSQTRVVVIGAGQAGGGAVEALRAAGPNPTFIRAPDANIQIVGHPPGGGGEIIANGGVTVSAGRDMSVPRFLIASRKPDRRTDLENPDFELKQSLAL